ncbi:MAG: hypothetical protein ABSE43_05385 [Steroidobacteraceae bacterium]|jgi:hypothetical protein
MLPCVAVFSGLVLLASAGAHGAAEGDGSAANPYVTLPPPVPEMARTREQLPLTLMNKVLEPLPADAAAPSADPHNMEGVWTNAQPLVSRMRTTMTGIPVPFSQEGARIITERIEADNAGRPLANALNTCRPPGTVRLLDLNFPFRILQTRDEIDVVFEELHAAWQIRMNQQHRIPAQREYGGDSIGFWDGSTLVVDITGFKQGLWLDTAGAPVSRDGTLVQRIRKIDGGRELEIITTVEDPVNYTSAWSFARRMTWRPDRYLAEYNCEQQIAPEETIVHSSLPGAAK